VSESKIKILILGAYSAVGRSIARGLLEGTDCPLIVTGRNRAKLEAAFAAPADPRLERVVLDALDRPELERACRRADLVINCVGPYIVNGLEIAEAVVAAGRHYLDFAYEQFHYRRMADLDKPAGAKGIALVTGAGEVVGFSSVLAALAAQKLGGLERVSIYALMGREEDAETGFSSFMNGVLEPALGNEDFIDGRLIPARFGADTPLCLMPAPFGQSLLLSDPSIDSFILPARFGPHTVRTYFGLGMAPPVWFFPLMRFLNPYKRRLFYRWTGGIVHTLMRQNHERKTRENVPEVQLLMLEAEHAGQSMNLAFRFKNDFNCTAYLPVIIAKMFAAGEVTARGLVTALDLVTPERLMRELEPHRLAGRLDWTIGDPRPV
jgi:hypothetical protein